MEHDYQHFGQSPRTGVAASVVSGDDGYFQAGYPGTRFVDLGNGTVLDLAHNPPLMWVKQPELIIPGVAGEPSGQFFANNQIQNAATATYWATETIYVVGDAAIDPETEGAEAWVCVVAHTSGSGTFAADRAAHATYWRMNPLATAGSTDNLVPAILNWVAAVGACRGGLFGGSFYYAGYDDWRLPNVRELQSLVTFGGAAGSYYPALPVLCPLSPFAYFAGTAINAESAKGFAVTFTTGATAQVTTTAAARFVIPVRGGITTRGGRTTR